jgi:hypothetical protein
MCKALTSRRLESSWLHCQKQQARAYRQGSGNFNKKARERSLRVGRALKTASFLNRTLLIKKKDSKKKVSEPASWLSTATYWYDTAQRHLVT